MGIGERLRGVVLQRRAFVFAGGLDVGGEEMVNRG